MSGIKFSNFGRSTLAATISSATVAPFTISAADGTVFYAYSTGDYEFVCAKDAIGNREIFKVDGRTGNAFNVVARAQGGTTARNWAIGDLFEAALTREGLMSLLVDTVLTGTTSVENLTVTGTGRRIGADWTSDSASILNRCGFQTTTVNGNTLLNTIPNGTATLSGYQAANSSDLSNCSIFSMFLTSSACFIANGIRGTGLYVPIKVAVGASAFVPVTYNIDGTTTTTGTRTHAESATDAREVIQRTDGASVTSLNTRVTNGLVEITAAKNGGAQSNISLAADGTAVLGGDAYAEAPAIGTYIQLAVGSNSQAGVNFNRTAAGKVNVTPGTDTRWAGHWTNMGITPGVTVDVSSTDNFPDGFYLVEIAGYSYPLPIRRGVASEVTSAIFTGGPNVVATYMVQYDGANTVSGFLRTVNTSTGVTGNGTTVIPLLYRLD